MKGHRGQDDVNTDVIALRVADPAATPAAAPRTAPIPVTDHDCPLNTPAKRRTAELLDLVLIGRSDWATLLIHLQADWTATDGLVPAPIYAARQKLFQHLLTQARDADRDWRDAEPQHCGPGQRTYLERCTGRDTCGRHRDSQRAWHEASDRFVIALHDLLPRKAREIAEAPPEARRTRRRSVQKRTLDHRPGLSTPHCQRPPSRPGDASPAPTTAHSPKPQPPAKKTSLTPSGGSTKPRSSSTSWTCSASSPKELRLTVSPTPAGTSPP